MGRVFIQRLIHQVNPLFQSILQSILRIRLAEKLITNMFHILFYYRKDQTWNNTYWLGVPVLKCPLDLWVYQEIIFDLRPDVIVECGTYKGGTAVFIAHILDILNNGKVISIDIKDWKGRPEHKRIDYLLGSSTSKDIVSQIARLINGKERIMAILDSDHSKEHVLEELKIYSSFVTKGSYLVVEDTDLNGHPVIPSMGPGPMEAVKQFIKGNNDFVIDRTKEKFFMTQNPNGYLLKVK